MRSLITVTKFKPCERVFSSFFAGVTLAGLMAFPAVALAQTTWSVENPGSGVYLPTSAWANCTCPPGGGSCWVPPAPTASPPIPGILGSDLVYAADARCQLGSPPCWCRGIGSSLVRIGGVGTNTLSIRWDAVANANHDCVDFSHTQEYTGPCSCPSTYNTGGSAIIDIDLLLKINGLPPGTPVTVNYRWRQFSANMYRPEVPPPGPIPVPPPPPYPPPAVWAPPPPPTVPDDESYVMGGSSIAGTGFGGGFNLLNERGGGQGPDVYGSFASTTDSIIIFTHDARLDVRMRSPGRGTQNPCLEYDSESVAWAGELVLSINVDAPPGGGFGTENCPSPTLHFSLDIGSDTERSDPTPDGNQVFDPGDAYAWLGAPMVPPGASGIRDDAFIFGGDPPPVPGGAGAPTCAAIPDPTPLLPAYFDLDGLDSMEVSLSALPGYSPSEPFPGPVPRFPSSCIYPVDFLSISFDDDTALHYASGGGAGCSVPSTSLSPVTDTYGTAAGRDEVIGLTLIPLMPAAPVTPRTVGALYPIANEVELHPSLAPNPPGGAAPPQEFDDDVDALDVTGDDCDTWVFSVDHEASLGLDPGHIYEATPGGPVLIVNKMIHLGLPPSVDIDDFEFVWTAEPGGSGGEILTLLFSVNDDDPATPALENGGILDPNMIYASNLTGAYIPYLDAPLDDDIDAITAACDRLTLPEPPSIIQWRSIRSHSGGLGDLPIVLNPATTGNGVSGPTVETRGTTAAGIGIRKIQVDLDQPVTLVGPVMVTERRTIGGVMQPPTTYSPDSVLMIDPDTLQMEFLSMPDEACYNIDLAGALQNSAGQLLGGDTDCNVRALFCDTNMTGGVNLGDMLATKAKNGQPAAANVQHDVNLTGGNINLGDALQVKSRTSPPAKSALCP